MHGLEIGRTPGDLSWFPPLPLEQHLELAPDGRRIEGLRFLIEQALQDMQALARDPCPAPGLAGSLPAFRDGRYI